MKMMNHSPHSTLIN